MTAASTWIDLGVDWTEPPDWFDSISGEKYATFQQQIFAFSDTQPTVIRNADAVTNETNASTAIEASSSPPHSRSILPWAIQVLTVIDIDVLPAPLERNVSHSIQAQTSLTASKPFDDTPIQVVANREPLRITSYQQRKMLVAKETP